MHGFSFTEILVCLVIISGSFYFLLNQEVALSRALNTVGVI